MAAPILMPDLGSGMQEGLLLNWTKQVGDVIHDGDVIAEIETDKTTVEVPVNASGTITELVGEPGQTLKVGAVIGYVDSANGSASAPVETPQAAPAPAANGSAPAASAGAAPSEPAAPPAEEVEEDGNLPGGVKASPVARKMAAERSIDLNAVTGTGPGGRITKSDVEEYVPGAAPAKTTLAAVKPASTSAPAAAFPAPSTNMPAASADVEIIDVSKMRSRIAQRMVESKQQVPHFYVTTVVDVEPMLALRKQINATLDEERKVSVNDLVVKAAAITLRQFPNLNSHFYGDKIVRYKRIHVGIAVALPNGGLMNVVAKDADSTSMSVMAAQNKAMIARARDNKVKPDDIQGSTFTVSNLGAYDVDEFAAIINPPEAAILAVSTASKVPVVKPDGSLGVGNRMKLTLSVDHRVSDGAEGAQFLQTLKKLLETPMQMLI
ncbi:MAG TPA: dihydrolipoamide acetyltransferase family protein [Candidatus Limnocylindrales bacterium]|nr:dihydrolipoamide acetyltransferase family protein [Candidatus Limnocylindrales bacterium]